MTAVRSNPRPTINILDRTSAYQAEPSRMRYLECVRPCRGSVPVIVSQWRPIRPTIARRWLKLLVVALLRGRRAILLVIAAGWRRRAVSVGRGAIAGPIVAQPGRLRRRCWAGSSPKKSEW